jgi:hypothetical protein
MRKGEFGSCCKDLGDAMTMPQFSLFRVEENGVLYLAIGYAQTPEGVGWFDQALIFCPFCGAQIQDREEIRRQSNQP